MARHQPVEPRPDLDPHPTGRTFGNAFIRDGDRNFRTYLVQDCGDEQLSHA